MDNINQNTNSVAKTSSGLNNVLSGIGIFILGFPLVFFLILPGLMSDYFDLGEGWVERTRIVVILIIIGCGFLGYILGKIKPNLSWKSGSLFVLPWIFVGVFLLSGFWDFAYSTDFEPQNFLIFLPIIIAVIISPISSYFGSRSRKS